ncbi:glutamine synthetase, partial [Guillardia theta CCMP2712]
VVEYVWIGGDGPLDLRSRAKVLPKTVQGLEDIPDAGFDGFQTNQAPPDCSEVRMKPRALFQDPFRPTGLNLMVLCDCWSPDKRPLPSNTRIMAQQLFDVQPQAEPWFSVTQEYTIFKDGKPLGWPSATARSFGGPTTQLGYPGPQAIDPGPYYCSAGADVSFGRQIAEAHLKACLCAGVKISGVHGQPMPGQWAFKVGTCQGIEMGDHLTMARYLLNRVGEHFGCVVSFDPKPIPGDWNGAGCHTSFSTKVRRIIALAHRSFLTGKGIINLERKHQEHIMAYGEGNERRLTGMHETAHIDTFSWGVGNCMAHIRVPKSTEIAGCGYLEDRRPASNMDPYVVTSMLFKTCCLD